MKNVFQAQAQKFSKEARNRRMIHNDRLLNDKVYLAMLESGIPPRKDMDEDVLTQSISATAGETLTFLKNREQFWEQIEIGGVYI